MEIFIGAIIIIELGILMYQMRRLRRVLKWKMNGIITLVWHRTLGGVSTPENDKGLRDFLHDYDE